MKDELGLQRSKRHNTYGCNCPGLDRIYHGSFKDSPKPEGLLTRSGDVRTFWVGLSVLLNDGRHANMNKKYCKPIVSMRVKTNNEGNWHCVRKDLV